MDTKTFEDEYHNRLPYYEKLKNVGLHQLSKAIHGRQFKYHDLDKRIKSPLSLYIKAQGDNIENPFDQIHDIVGLRVVCLFLSDIRKIHDILEDTFNIIDIDDKIKNTDAKTFDYLGINYTVKLKNPSKEQLDIKDLPFEIQLRTINQDTWAVISHDLDYKKTNPIPEDSRRGFYALSGLLHIADTHFEILKNNTHGNTP